ncbi:hypothetical protein SGFS_040110 [Streptomyces graminofaciens]|uniref:Lipoprotein n=1 Tax=Streptomyces graminofaciens TaxID=68212 RepID=A0ABN5VKF6_9ACTN|nr:hypothetical protein [Streptomyces graminofaciens]BBC32717.1 hypothetical protein SGFS_040110 [Streptomyces graminofaciens]
MWRRMVTVVGVAAGSVMLSGCSAVDLPLAAVTVDADGVPRALIRPCGDGDYEGPQLEGWAGSDEEGDVTQGWKVKGERSGDAEIPLFSPPDAGRVRYRGERRLLPDHTYQLVFWRYVTTDSYNGVVTFTAEDVAGLEHGQVWADGRAMSPEEFEELAEDSC